MELEYTWGPRDYFVLKGWPRAGAGESKWRDFTDGFPSIPTPLHSLWHFYPL